MLTNIPSIFQSVSLVIQLMRGSHIVNSFQKGNFVIPNGLDSYNAKTMRRLREYVVALRMARTFPRHRSSQYFFMI